MTQKSLETERRREEVLTTPEIVTLCEKGVGLRWMKPYRAELEQEEGTSGDIVVLSNL